MNNSKCDCTRFCDDIFLGFANGIGPVTVTSNTPATTPIELGSLLIIPPDDCSSVVITVTGSILTQPRLTLNPSFRLMKICNGIKRQISGNLTVGTGLHFNFSQVFSYQICDCKECFSCDNECITYSLELTPGSTTTPEPPPIIYTISDITLAAKKILTCC